MSWARMLCSKGSWFQMLVQRFLRQENSYAPAPQTLREGLTWENSYKLYSEKATWWWCSKSRGMGKQDSAQHTARDVSRSTTRQRCQCVYAGLCHTCSSGRTLLLSLAVTPCDSNSNSNNSSGNLGSWATHQTILFFSPCCIIN